MGRPDEDDDASSLAGDLGERALRRMDEARPEEEVLGRVAGDRELGEEDDVCPGGLRIGQPGEDPLSVSVEVADGRVDLGKRESHRGFRLRV